MSDASKAQPKLLDRSSLQTRLARAIADAIASNQNGVFVVLELETGPHFTTEDELFREAAIRLLKMFRNRFEVFILGNRQLAVILYGFGSQCVAKHIVEKMVDRLEYPFQASVCTIVPNVRAGFVEFPTQAVSSASVIAKADLALQKARQLRFCMFDETLQDAYEKQRTRRIALRRSNT